PYQESLRPGAPHKAEEILRDLKYVIARFKPTKIFLSHPADHNSDHIALYLFTLVATWDLNTRLTPSLHPYLTHFKRWPTPRGYKPASLLRPPKIYRYLIPWEESRLTQRYTATKLLAIKHHRSQYRPSHRYLRSFVRKNELFGRPPVVLLKPDSKAYALTANRTQFVTQLPEHLTTQLGSRFVGVEEEFMQLNSETLTATIKLSKPFSKNVGLSLYLFGYRQGRPFANMPKINLRFSYRRFRIFDKNQALDRGDLRIRQRPLKLTAQIPLKTLGNPQILLTGARTSFGRVPLDWISWRTLVVSK
ncbi:hypothetical protein KY320_01955, partial [Candidatus Woesearchaeota archaeon]|nr:hypothetical protein [Candidatus Woesearchaeota archaeon]